MGSVYFVLAWSRSENTGSLSEDIGCLDFTGERHCIRHFHWMILLFKPIKFDVTIVSAGNNCNVKPDWPESSLGTVVKSNLIDKNHPVNLGNPSYNWVPMFSEDFQCFLIISDGFQSLSSCIRYTIH